MASNQPNRSGHLDAGQGRTVVFCHACHREWYQDEFGLSECPHCGSGAVEVVTLENDPREIYQDGGAAPAAPAAAVVPPQHQHDNFPDPDEADIDEYSHAGPGFIFHERIFGNGGPGRPRQPHGHDHDHDHDHDQDYNHDHLHQDHFHDNDHHDHGRPTNPGDEHMTLHRFVDMMNGLGWQRMAPPDLLAGARIGGDGGGGIRHTTYTSNDGSRISSISFTATIGRGRAPPRAGGGEGPMPFAPTFRDLLGGLGPPPGMHDHDHDHDREGMPINLGNLLNLLTNPANARHGDAVYTQEALDRIITALMENNPQSNAAPPASEDALSKLERSKVDEKLLASEGGKMECTICIEELAIDEEVVHLPCKHLFHDQCVVMWLKEHNTCPICRTPIEENSNRSSGSNGGRNRGTRSPEQQQQQGPAQGQGQGQPGEPQARWVPLRAGESPFSFNLWSSNGRAGPSTSRDSPMEDVGRNRDRTERAADGRRDFASRWTRTDESQPPVHDTLQSISRDLADRRRNRPVSTLHHAPSSPYVRPRRSSMSPPHSHSAEHSRTRDRSPSLQSRRSGASDRERGSGTMGWFRELRDHLPGRRDERRQP